MEGFKLASASATADEALAAADQLEQAIGEICNGQRRAGNVPMEPMAVLVQFARNAASDMAQLVAEREQLQSLLERTQSENEALAERMAVRMEELQQAVQARLVAEKQVGQLSQLVKGANAFSVGRLITVNQDEYPGLGGLFVQLWNGDAVAARVYGNDREELQRRIDVLNTAQQPVVLTTEVTRLGSFAAKGGAA